eukprot:scaffold570072_cov19-Prasinocladus_malaysianus.AAC.1
MTQQSLLNNKVRIRYRSTTTADREYCKSSRATHAYEWRHHSTGRSRHLIAAYSSRETAPCLAVEADE